MLLAGFFIIDFGFGEDKDLGGLFSQTAVEPSALSGANSSSVPGCNGEWQGGRWTGFHGERLGGWLVSWLQVDGYGWLVNSAIRV